MKIMSIPRNYESFEDLRLWINANMTGAAGDIDIVNMLDNWVLVFACNSDATMFQLKWPSENSQPKIHV